MLLDLCWVNVSHNMERLSVEVGEKANKYSKVYQGLIYVQVSSIELFSLFLRLPFEANLFVFVG